MSTLDDSSEQDGAEPFAKYEQILNIVFGAGFGALGSVSLRESTLSLSWFAITLYIVALAIPTIWIIAAFATVSRCIASGKAVRTWAYLMVFLFLAGACAFIILCSKLADGVGVVGRGPELSSILAAWAVTYLLSGWWVAARRKLL